MLARQDLRAGQPALCRLDQDAVHRRGYGHSLAAYAGADKAEVASLIDSKWGNRKKSAIGYLGTKDGALPKLR